jgi:hypothetical protein
LDEPVYRDQQLVQPGQDFPEIITASPELFHPQIGMDLFPGITI